MHVHACMHNYINCMTIEDRHRNDTSIHAIYVQRIHACMHVCFMQTQIPIDHACGARGVNRHKDGSSTHYMRAASAYMYACMCLDQTQIPISNYCKSSQK